MNIVKILLLEDIAANAVIIKKYLDRRKMNFQETIVTSKLELMILLDEKHFDIVLADHSASSIEALKMARKKDKNIPFILVSGAVSEEAAIRIMKVEDADDYILIDHLKRLPTAIRKAIEHGKIKRAKESCEDQLQEKTITQLFLKN
jgi:CheY-like chemotaxis protein